MTSVTLMQRQPHKEFIIWLSNHWKVKKNNSCSYISPLSVLFRGSIWDILAHTCARITHNKPKRLWSSCKMQFIAMYFTPTDSSSSSCNSKSKETKILCLNADNYWSKIHLGILSHSAMVYSVHSNFLYEPNRWHSTAITVLIKPYNL